MAQGTPLKVRVGKGGGQQCHGESSYCVTPPYCSNQVRIEALGGCAEAKIQGGCEGELYWPKCNCEGDFARGGKAGITYEKYGFGGYGTTNGENGYVEITVLYHD